MQVKEFIYFVVDPRKESAMIKREVRWLKLVDGWLKLNTDGSVVGASGLAGCGRVIRDSTSC